MDARRSAWTKALGLLLLAAAGCASAPSRDETSASRAVAEQAGWGEGSPVAAKASASPGVAAPAPHGERRALIVLDVGEGALASYEITLEYDPEGISVRSVSPPPPGIDFPGSPITDRSTFGSGRTPLVGFTVGGPFPSGRVVVARVELVPRTPKPRTVSVSVKSLYDAQGNPIPGTAYVVESGEGGR